MQAVMRILGLARICSFLHVLSTFPTQANAGGYQGGGLPGPQDTGDFPFAADLDIRRAFILSCADLSAGYSKNVHTEFP